MTSPLNSAGDRTSTSARPGVAEPRQDVVAERAQRVVDAPAAGSSVAAYAGTSVDSGRPLSSQNLRPPLMIRTSSWPYSLSCQYAHAANQLLLSPYRTIVVSGPMPDADSSAEKSSRLAMSRRMPSDSWLVQFQPTAPGMWLCS